MKSARRTLAIGSTISIPPPATMFPMEAIVNPTSRGSRLDADHPRNGVLIPCRFTDSAESEHFIRQQCEIGSDHEFELFPTRRVSACRLDDLLDKGKIQQRLTALKLDFDCRRGGCESDAKCTYCPRLTHVETIAINTPSAYLTILSHMFAAYTHAHNMNRPA